MKYTKIWILILFYFSILFNISAQNTEDGWDNYWDKNQEFIDLLMSYFPKSMVYVGAAKNNDITIVYLLDKSSLTFIGKLYEFKVLNWSIFRNDEKIEPVDQVFFGFLCDCNNNKIRISYIIDPITMKRLKGKEEWWYSYSSSYAERIIKIICSE